MSKAYLLVGSKKYDGKIQIHLKMESTLLVPTKLTTRSGKFKHLIFSESVNFARTNNIVSILGVSRKLVEQLVSGEFRFTNCIVFWVVFVEKPVQQ